MGNVLSRFRITGDYNLLNHEFKESDHISALHESIISHILSRLPTKDAIRTSILSKDWKYTWTSFYNVDIDDNVNGKYCTWESFYAMTDRILALSQHLTSFRLNCSSSCHDLSRVQKLVSAVLSHNIESFDIRYFETGIFVYQVNLLNSTSLKKLKLQHCNSILNVATMNCAPNLTSLYFSGVEIVNNSYDHCNNSTSVTFTFPVLQTFVADWISFTTISYVEIYAPLLTKFSIGSSYLYGKELEYSIVLVAPKLTAFAYTGNVPGKITLKYGSSVLSASLLSESEIDEVASPINIGLHVVELINGLTNVEELKLSRFIAEVYMFGPPFHRLGKLKKLTFVHLLSAQQLLEVLKASPMLEFLSINTSGLDAYDYEAIKPVPSCIISHLKEIEFSAFFLEKPCYDLAKFLLENGKMLKKISIFFPMRENNKAVIVKKYLSAILPPGLIVDIS